MAAPSSSDRVRIVYFTSYFLFQNKTKQKFIHNFLLLHQVEQNRSRAALHQTGAHRSRLLRRGLQRHRQGAQQLSRRHKDHRPGGGRGRDRRHPAGDPGALAVRQPASDQVLRLIPQSNC